MRSFVSNKVVVRTFLAGGLTLLGLVAVASGEPRTTPANQSARQVSDHAKIISSPFQGVKANTGTVAITHENGKCVLTLSDDFQVPQTPAPHWQVVDSKGNAYLLNLLKIKGDKYNQSITVPSYIGDVAKVQIWCAFAEVNLGEAAFASPVPNK